MCNFENYKKILYVIDMVNGFVREGVLHDKEIAKTIPEQIKIIEEFKNENQAIAFIKDNHEKDAAEFANFPEHCVIGTSEAELIDEFKKYENESLVYPKNSTSAMFAPNLINDIEKMKYLEKVVLVGCCTDICVLNFAIPLKNYFNQTNRKIDIIVVKNATETYNIPNVHDRDYYSKISYELMNQAGIKKIENFEQL